MASAGALASAQSRIARSMEAIQSTLTQSAESTGSVFSDGAEKLLTVMNSTLESIQDNTSVGAQALSSAAADLKQAGEAFRQQMDEAARDGGNELWHQTGWIARLTDELTSKPDQRLISRRESAADHKKLDQVAGASADLRMLSDGVRSGADATRSFRQAIGHPD
jgi:hypothetical protein